MLQVLTHYHTETHKIFSIPICGDKPLQGSIPAITLVYVSLPEGAGMVIVYF